MVAERGNFISLNNAQFGVESREHIMQYLNRNLAEFILFLFISAGRLSFFFSYSPSVETRLKN